MDPGNCNWRLALLGREKIPSFSTIFTSINVPSKHVTFFPSLFESCSQKVLGWPETHSSCLSLTSSGITGVHHHAQLACNLFEVSVSLGLSGPVPLGSGRVADTADTWKLSSSLPVLYFWTLPITLAIFSALVLRSEFSKAEKMLYTHQIKKKQQKAKDHLCKKSLLRYPIYWHKNESSKLIIALFYFHNGFFFLKSLWN
jgi:hypothetical protein